MRKPLSLITVFLICMAWFSQAWAQGKKLEKIRVGGGSVGAPQMTMWYAKEANLYEKHGLAVEAIHIPGSSMALQAMLSGEVSIIQLGGAASMQANLAGADTVIVATVLKKFLFSIFSRRDITRIADLKGKLFGATRFGTVVRFRVAVLLWREMVSIRSVISPWFKPVANRKLSWRSLPGKVQAAALSVPATMRAKQANMRELFGHG